MQRQQIVIIKRNDQKIYGETYIVNTSSPAAFLCSEITVQQFNELEKLKDEKRLTYDDIKRWYPSDVKDSQTEGDNKNDSSM